MFFNKKIHPHNLYNILLELSRNKFFYQKVKLPDSFETRINLMFTHFSIILYIYKRRKEKFDQIQYDNLFNSIENNLREIGLGDVSVNDKMKTLNKILYDILLKLNDKNNQDTFKMNHNLVKKYFTTLNDINCKEFSLFETYFHKFYNYCFEIPSKNMLKQASNFIN